MIIPFINYWKPRTRQIQILPDPRFLVREANNKENPYITKTATGIAGI